MTRSAWITDAVKSGGSAEADHPALVTRIRYTCSRHHSAFTSPRTRNCGGDSGVIVGDDLEPNARLAFRVLTNAAIDQLVMILHRPRWRSGKGVLQRFPRRRRFGRDEFVTRSPSNARLRIN
jgi:hypothetical protein